MAGQHGGQNHPARLSGEDRKTLRQGRASLGDGPGHPDRGSAGGNAGQRSAGALSGGHAQRTLEPIRSPSYWSSLGRPCAKGVHVKLLPEEGELYVLAESKDRVNKERSMRRRQLKGLVKRLKESGSDGTDAGPTVAQAGRGQKPVPGGLAAGHPPSARPGNRKCAGPISPSRCAGTSCGKCGGAKGVISCAAISSAQAPEKLWQFYIQLTQVEAAFKDLKDDLSLRPIFHQLEQRIEAHIFVSFLAYCLHVSLRACLRPLAPGLTPALAVGKVRRHPNARRAFSHHRRTRTGV